VLTGIKEKRKQYRIIYELMNETPRIRLSSLSKTMKMRPSIIGKRMQEAFDYVYVVRIQIRRRSYANFKEYVYFVKCEDPEGMYEKYTRDENVVYHLLLDGFCDLLVISRGKIDIKGDIVFEGPRSDYHISVPPDRSWDTAISIVQKKLEDFDPEEYQPKGIITCHWDETIEWDEEDEILFRELKYDLRKPVTPLMDKYQISGGKAWEWLRRLPETCTIVTGYYPESISGYDPLVYLFETDYEDFIIELFSELPSTCWFFKVSDRLVLYLWVDRGSMENANRPISDISKLHIRNLVRDLLKKGIINSKARARVECYWRKD